MLRWEICIGGELTTQGSKILVSADESVSSFKTDRYLGVEGDQVRETRMMSLPP